MPKSKRQQITKFTYYEIVLTAQFTELLAKLGQGEPSLLHILERILIDFCRYTQIADIKAFSIDGLVKAILYEILLYIDFNSSSLEKFCREHILLAARNVDVQLCQSNKDFEEHEGWKLLLIVDIDSTKVNRIKNNISQNFINKVH